MFVVLLVLLLSSAGSECVSNGNGIFDTGLVMDVVASNSRAIESSAAAAS